ncbi:membrane protein [Bathymodiolus azoricus thioautotrophic gill symbiont]|uniref:Membrane protein n=1 Tax=Bathymodiolus azoricus thioautotrophic gill symbiont TaxID=235205 RepID=A0A1H6JC62_9GAMM|nr:membrane protein [Bathymodiolus azoricus thioautotrophic gill symbiont]
MVYCVSLNLVNEPGLIVPFATLILLMPNDAILMASLKLNVIVLAATLAPPLPTIVRIGLIASSTKLPLAIKSVNKLAL